jgi:hypothetical protein
LPPFDWVFPCRVDHRGNRIAQPSGKESWAYRFRFHGRSRKYTIGDASKLSVKDARVLARKAYLSVIKCRSGCGKETIAER